MSFKLTLFFMSIALLTACAEKVVATTSDAEKAFAKIDKKNESLFTKSERKRNYQESIAQAEENNKSNESDAIYNGYGSSPKKRKKTEIKTTKTTKKKVTYKSSAPVTYSAYSTN